MLMPPKAEYLLNTMQERRHLIRVQLRGAGEGT